MLTSRVVSTNFATGKKQIEGECLSTDTKPTDVANGSTLIEMDTSTMYFFDENARVWRAW